MTEDGLATPAALDGVRVLDLAGEIGQYCTKLLADLGADVIKVEPPEGDPVRLVPPFYHDEPGPEHSLYWFNLNTNKRGITLSLQSSRGREIFARLAATANVVVESFDPGYLDAVGLGYSGLTRLRADIILTSVTGFGQTGPHAHWKAPDLVGVAMGGTMWLAGDPRDPPNLPPWRQGYISASIQAAVGTLLALYHRDLTGEGQHVDVSMQEALAITQETAAATWDMLQVVRCRNAARGMVPIDVPGIGMYQCRDGYVYGYVGSPGGAGWPELLGWMEEEGMAADLSQEPYRSATESLSLRSLAAQASDTSALASKLPLFAHIDEILRRFVGSKTKWEMYEQAQRRRLLFGIVSTPEDIARNPQLLHRRWLTAVEHPELGETLMYPGPPYRLSETPWSLRRRPPMRGEHTWEVLCGELGLAEGELEELRKQGMV